MPTPDARLARTTRAGDGMPGELARRSVTATVDIRRRAGAPLHDPSLGRRAGQLAHASLPTEVDVPALPGGPLLRGRDLGGRP